MDLEPNPRFFTAPADTARAMHAAEMRGQDMITEAECQRRIDAAVAAEREACAAVADFEADDLDADAKRFRSGSDPHYWRKNLAETHRLISAAIRARGQK